MINENYEVAYINWESKNSHDAAFEQPGGKKVFKDAQTMLDTLMYQQIRPFISKKLDMDPNTMDLYFGRPLIKTISMFGLQVELKPDGTFFLTMI